MFSCWNSACCAPQKSFTAGFAGGGQSTCRCQRCTNPSTSRCVAPTAPSEFPPNAHPRRAVREQEGLRSGSALLPRTAETLLLAPAEAGIPPRENSNHLFHISGLTQDVLGARQHSPGGGAEADSLICCTHRLRRLSGCLGSRGTSFCGSHPEPWMR